MNLPSRRGGRKSPSVVGSVLVRVVAALALTFATWNPFGLPSIARWIADGELSAAAVTLVVLLTAAAHIAFVVAAYKALGRLGSVVFGAIAAACAWLAYDLGWLAGTSVAAQTALLVAYGTYLGAGAAGAIAWRRLTGQMVTDEAPDIVRAAGD